MSSAHAYQAQQVTGEFQDIGVYTNTVDADYVVPADASLIIWNVPAQTVERFIDFTNIPEGAEVQVVIFSSNGESVTEAPGGSFSLNDVAPRVVNVRSQDGAGLVTLSDGTAAQYDVGTSGSTIGLNNGNNDLSGLVTPSGGFSGRVTAKGASGTNPSGLTESQLITQKLVGGQYVTQIYYLHGAALNQKYWDILAEDNGTWSFRAVNDAFTTSNDGIRMTRVGFVPSVLLVPQSGSLTIGPVASNTAFGGKRMGQSTLVAGTVTVPDTTITAGSVINATPHGAGTGILNVAITAGVSFTITSSDGTDVRLVSWERTIL